MIIASTLRIRSEPEPLAEDLGQLHDVDQDNHQLDPSDLALDAFQLLDVLVQAADRLVQPFGAVDSIPFADDRAELPQRAGHVGGAAGDPVKGLERGAMADLQELAVEPEPHDRAPQVQEPLLVGVCRGPGGVRVGRRRRSGSRRAGPRESLLGLLEEPVQDQPLKAGQQVGDEIRVMGAELVVLVVRVAGCAATVALAGRLPDHGVRSGPHQADGGHVRPVHAEDVRVQRTGDLAGMGPRVDLRQCGEDRPDAPAQVPVEEVAAGGQLQDGVAPRPPICHRRAQALRQGSDQVIAQLGPGIDAPCAGPAAPQAGRRMPGPA